MRTNNYDILVVGAGILGIAHAYHCARSGLKVALLERNKFPQDATVRNFGQIVPSGMSSKWQLFGRESLKTYFQIQSEFDITVRQQGSVYLASNTEEMILLEEQAAINQTNNYHSALWSKNQCLQRYPGLKEEYVVGGLFYPDEINLDPRIAARNIIRYCVEKYGLVYYPSTLVKNIVRANGEVILTSALGDFVKASKVFLCSGCEFQILYPDLFRKSDLELVKIQMLTTFPQQTTTIPGSILTGWTIRRYESFQECHSYRSIIKAQNPDSYQQRFGVHILFKQSQDGSIIIGDTHEYAHAADPEKLGFDINNKLNEFVIEEAKKIFDLESWKIKKSWLGLYCQCSKEDVFQRTIDQHIHIVTGIGGKGMTASFGFASDNIEKQLGIKPFK